MSRRILPDGTRLNANTYIKDAKDHNEKYRSNGTHIVALTKKVPKGDKNNRSKASIEYEGIVVSGPMQGQRITGIRSGDMFGGSKNYGEIVYDVAKENFEGKNPPVPESTDASMVMVTFMDGNTSAPIILGGFPNKKNEKVGITEDDGTTARFHYNGVDFNINKEGTLKVNRGSSVLQIDKDGNVDIKSDTAINIESAGSITIGSSGAAQQAVLGNLFQSLYNNHTHGGGQTPDQPMTGTHLSSKIKVE